MDFKIKKTKGLYLYRQMLVPRIIEEQMLLFLRKGKISKWFSGIGQEAISVGVTEALNSDLHIQHLRISYSTSYRL